MKRDPFSHKGENGKVAVIGGSRHQHGAPLFAMLAAEASGVDLLYVLLPARHEEAAKAASRNVQVHPFHADDLAEGDVDAILELLATMDCAVIGPGIARTHASLAACRSIIAGASCPLVLDATALQPWTLEASRGKTVVWTPHAGELERMELSTDTLMRASEDHGVFLLKGPEDRIIGGGKDEKIAGGNAGLTVGGTGDALAGLAAGLIAQGETPFDACVIASTIIKRAGTKCAETKGYAYTATDVIGEIAALLHAYA